MGLCGALVREYMKAVEAAGIEADGALLTEVVRLVGPHLEKEQLRQSEEEEND